MPEAPIPEAPPAEAQGGGAGEAIVDLDKRVGAFMQAVTQNPNVPEELKAEIASAAEALRAAIGALVDAASGGGAPPPQAGGVVTPEQGGGRAVPVRA
jgi:hypothetical protein